MSRPTVEVADIFRAQGKNFIDRHRKRMRFQQLKVMQAIVRCRTAALGGHIDMSAVVSPWNARLPQSISYNTAPKLNTSVR